MPAAVELNRRLPLLSLAINNKCLRFPERMLTFACSRYAPPPAPYLFIPERCLLVILTAKTVFFRRLRDEDTEERF